jgi:hypothetical protein
MVNRSEHNVRRAAVPVIGCKPEHRITTRDNLQAEIFVTPFFEVSGGLPVNVAVFWENEASLVVHLHSDPTPAAVRVDSHFIPG